MNLDPDKYYFSDTSFNLLMQKRIRKILLICSNYDAFMLEEDGRIEEQIFNEYVSLNLRYPPGFIHANSEENAVKILQNDNIDLIIIMLGQDTTDVFKLARKLKNLNKNTPLVLLTHFTREISIRIENENLDVIDYVFSWLGNADLLLAIIKLIEDKMNAEFDILNIGVQCILFVEDSVRYISTFLPALYKAILEHSRDFTTEALNEHQKMLRKRGRPKILLASNLEDAKKIFAIYKSNLIGVISDISFRETSDRRSNKISGGLELAKIIKSEDDNIPIIFQSSDINNREKTINFNSHFIHKQSPRLVEELENYLLNDFGFGDFIFRDPYTLEEVSRAGDLKSLQQEILTIRADIYEYHAKRDHFSRWLKARALFPIARLLKDIKTEDFEHIEQSRKFICNTITRFRASKSSGIIADFDTEQFDEYFVFARSGEGSLGGKARGLAFLDSILKKHSVQKKFKDVVLSIPRTLALATSVFDDFINHNNLFEFAINCEDDDQILDKFVQSEIPEKHKETIQIFIKTINNPIAIRSSSKLEDSYYQSFAGVYTTYMVNIDLNDEKQVFQDTLNAIKCVYASVFFKSSKSYITSTSNLIDEEKMGVILQELCGSWKGDYFYPTISGVARSLNFYPMDKEKTEDGSASIALGLGKYIVDGGLALHFCPKYPKNSIQLSSTGQMIKNTQKSLYVLDKKKKFIPSKEPDQNLAILKINNIDNIPGQNHIFSIYDYQNDMVQDSVLLEGKKLITFSSVLKHDSFPLVSIINNILDLGKTEMNNHIEIEYAIDFKDKNEQIVFNILQIRPIRVADNLKNCFVESSAPDDCIIYSTSALGNGYYGNIKDLVYVKEAVFNPANNTKLAEIVEQINDDMKKKGKYYILIGPGRWGSADPWLGIPVTWPQVSNAKVIVEYHQKDYNVEASQGSHFFHNLIQFGVGYLSVGNYNDPGVIDHQYMGKAKAKMEDEYIKVISLEKDLKICVDGKNSNGVVFKPEK